MAVRAVPATFVAAFAFLEAAYDGLGRRKREAEDAFDMREEQFRRHLRLTKETVWWLCDEVTDELKGSRPTALAVERQPAVSNCVRRVARAVVNAGTRNKCVHFPRTPEEKAAVKEGFLRLGPLPCVIGCVDGCFVAIVAPRGEQKASFWCRKGYYALNVMFCSWFSHICDAYMRILAVDPLRPGSDHDIDIWGTTWVRERFEEGRIDTTGEYLLGEK
ncbi:hypothetical protein MTO96_050842 [Rhipicephalus appendiculatus]